PVTLQEDLPSWKQDIGHQILGDRSELSALFYLPFIDPLVAVKNPESVRENLPASPRCVDCLFKPFQVVSHMDDDGLRCAVPTIFIKQRQDPVAKRQAMEARHQSLPSQRMELTASPAVDAQS